jgi:hypothetical protein
MVSGRGCHQRKRDFCCALHANVRRIEASPVTLSSLGSFGGGTGNIAVAANGDVLAVWSFRTTNTYLPNEEQAAFFSGGHWGSTITISNKVYGNVNGFGLPGIGFDSHSQATLI